MKSIYRLLLAAGSFALTLNFSQAANHPAAGFSLPDSVSEMTLRYKTVKNLIILPVTLNDSVQVNLILDTGCRNLILFGKRFTKRFLILQGRRVEFSGLGSGRAVNGELSIGNKVSIDQVLGSQIPVVVVPGNNLFASYDNVDGVIGYDIFLKFEVEVNASQRTITFRPALKSVVPKGYTHVPLKISDARPVTTSEVFISPGSSRRLELMIDTGSSLGLLMKTTNIEDFDHYKNEAVLGIGFNGPLSGYHTISDRLLISDLEIKGVSTGIVSSQWHNKASIGMEVLKDFVFILNYCKGYACFKELEPNV